MSTSEFGLPPFTITPEILNRIAAISEAIGRLTVLTGVVAGRIVELLQEGEVSPSLQRSRFARRSFATPSVRQSKTSAGKE